MVLKNLIIVVTLIGLSIVSVAFNSLCAQKIPADSISPQLQTLYEKAHGFDELNMADSALKYANKGLDFSKNITDLMLSVKLYQSIAESFLSENDSTTALQVLLKADALNDSLFVLLDHYGEDYLLKLNESKKQKELISDLTKERSKQNMAIQENKKTIEQQKALIFLGLIVSGFFIIIVVILLALVNQKRKAFNYLTDTNKKIAQQKEEIESQRQHLIEANKELDKLSIVARETDNGIKIMDAVGKVTWVNEGYTKLHGYRLEDLQNIEGFNLLGEESNINIQELVSVWYGDKKPISFESLAKTKNGEEIYLQTTLTPILNEKEKVEKMIAIESDITPIKKAEKEILSKNLDITASISYAKRIQEAMIPPFSILTQHYPNSFCFYEPKSIVSGDFYWISMRNNRLIVVCADATGHGVPGAFMSLLGISFLNKIVNEKGFVSPATILNRLRMNIINHLNQSGNGKVAGDGLDLSMVSIDIDNQMLEFSGAMNPIYILRKGDFIELKGDRMPVGFFDNEDRPFSTTSFSIKQHDQLFMFSDGYYDQFGGEHSHKMKTQRFKDILLNCADKTANDQYQIIEQGFHNWKNNHPQVDDVLVLGITFD